MAGLGLLQASTSVLMVIDIQEKLMPVIAENELVFSNVNKLIQGAQILNLPIIVTEQYPKGLGNTCSEIKLPENQPVIQKTCFSCMLSEGVNETLARLKTKSVIITGAEAHICVLKTALDALEHRYDVHIVADAVSSRTLANKQIALERLKQSGAFISSVEMILFQLLDYAGTDQFKQISKLIK